MKFRTFGDSWAWCWSLQFNSKELNEKMYYDPSKMKNGERYAVDILTIYMDRLGHNIDIHNTPGESFNDVLDYIRSNTDTLEKVDHNIVYFSGLLRPDIHNFDVSNYYNFCNQYDTLLINLLQELDKWAIEKNESVLMVGGHSWFDPETFKKANCKNVKLLSDCLITDISNRLGFQVPNLKNKFRFADYWIKDIDETFDEILIDEILNSLKITDVLIHEMKSFIMVPDHNHLNATGMLFFLDLLFEYLENEG